MNIRSMLVVLLSVCFCVATQAQSSTKDKPLKIRAVYPTGEQVATRDRITIEFNQNIVALGASMFVEDVVPIDIEPAVECEWNWVKLNTLQCELPVDDDLEAATRYTVTIRPGITAPNGQMMDKEYIHHFETILPAITYTDLVSWLSPTQPIIRVSFNQQVNLDTLKERLLLHDAATGKDVPSRIWPRVDGLTYELGQDFFSRAKAYEKYNYLDELVETGASKKQFLVLPQEPLSKNSNVFVLLLPGVEGVRGSLTTKERVLVDAEVRTFDEFRFLGLECQNVFGEEIFLAVDQPHESTCKVRSSFILVFSSRFLDRVTEDIVHIQTQNDALKITSAREWFRPQPISRYRYSVSGDFKSDSTYKIHLSTTEQTSESDDRVVPITDGFGRPLVGTNEIAFQTERPLPRTSVSQRSVVVVSDSTVDPTISLGNVDDVSIVYDILDEAGVQSKQTLHVQSSDQDDVLHEQFLGLRDALRSPSGVMSGRVVGQPRFNHPSDTIESPFFAQATPYSVSVKLGTVDSLAWVVSLHTGEPIANANVELYLGNPQHLNDKRDSIFSGKTNDDGLVLLPGYDKFDRDWDRAVEDMHWDCREKEDCPMYFLRVDGEEGMALLPLDDDYELYGHYYLPSIDSNLDHFTTTSQPLYRPGDTVQIKGYVRTRRNEVRIIPEEGHFGLCIRGPRSIRTYEITPISLNQFGAYHASFQLNNRTEFGEYRMSLVFDPHEPVLNPCSYFVYESGGEFEVFEFNTNPIQVTHHLNNQVFEHGEDVTITTRAEFHAGGPYAQEYGRLIVHIEPDDPPIESVSKYDYSISRNPSEGYWGRNLIVDTDFSLNEEGKHTLTLRSFDNETYYGTVQIESSVMSDRGKYVATRTTATYYGVDQFVALRQPWLYDTFIDSGQLAVGESWPIEVLVISKEDRIVPEKLVQIKVYIAQKEPSEPSLFWGRSSDIVWEEVFQCDVVSAEEPVSCDFTPTETNYYRIDAEIEDTKGNTHRSSLWLTTYVDDHPPREVVVRPKPVELELICDSDEVKVGDLIRCEVKNFPDDVPILVTIERTSVIDHWLVRLDSNNPIIEFPVLEHYEPQFELSVLAQSPLSEASIWGDKRYQFARTKFTLDNPRLHPLDITVNTNRDTYRPRDTVKLSLSTNRDSTKPIEYTIAVIDEAILDLSKTGSVFFDPTKKDWELVESEVRTYGLIRSLMETSELRSSNPEPYEDTTARPIRSGPSYATMMAPELTFENERIADPNVRDVDWFVAYWNPSIVATDGRLKLDFVLPDNLTRWRVLVMAVSTDDRFGYTSTSFASMKDTEVRPVVPNVVTEGDAFQIGASILNRADRRRKLTIELQATGELVEGAPTTYEEQITFMPFERKVVAWNVQAGRLSKPVDPQNPIETSEIRVIASAGDRRDSDALDIKIPVRSNQVRVSSAVYGALEGDRTTIPIGIPGKLQDQNGQLDLTLTTNASVNFDGVFRYAIEYPYSCWEQELTQALLAMQYLKLEERGAKHGVQWSNPEQKITQVLASAVDFQTPDGGMAYFVPRSDSEDPYLSAYTAIAFSWLEDAGYEVSSDVTQKLLQYLRDFLVDQLEDLQDADQDGEEVQLDHLDATVGAVVLYALATWEELNETELTQYSNQIKQMDLFGLSHYLLASLTIDPTQTLNNEIFERIMNHRSLVDGAIEFVESVPLWFTSILHSDTRSLCSVLSALTKLSNTSNSKLELSELKELSNAVRYSRENLPHWRNTQDNVFCTDALIAFFDYIDSDDQDLFTTIDLRSNHTGFSTRLVDRWEFNTNITKLHTQHTLQSQIFGSHGNIEILRNGNGTAFYNVELSYLTTADERINRFSGFELHREYVVYRGKQWYVLKPGDHINKGEHVLVNLYLNNRFDRDFVVVDDTVPGGLEPVNSNLNTAFLPPFVNWELDYILSESELYKEFKEARFWSFRYRELGLKNVRYFANSIDRGKYHLSWLAQAIAAGEFTVLPAHAEEMYRPVMFGKSKPWTLMVEP